MRRRIDQTDTPPPEPPPELVAFDYPAHAHIDDDDAWRAVYTEWLARRDAWAAEHGVTLPPADELWNDDWI